ncbi:MAG: hypothetical protein HFJ58_01770 [Clostridia bacterium]|nr:hypothetical protein [Clostridia bacterium]
MINTKTLKLSKIFKFKEYLQEKSRRDIEYKEYVKQSIKQAEEDLKNGRYYTLEEIKIELQNDLEEYAMMKRE